MHNNNASLKNKAMQFLQGNKPSEAKKYSLQACKADRRDVEAWTLLAAANARLGLMQDVSSACHEIISLQPDNFLGHYNLGVASQALGKSEKACKAYQTALTIQPDNPAALLNYGFTQISVGLHQEAIDTFNRLLNTNQNTANALNGIGLALMHLGRLQDSIDAFHKSIAITADIPEVHYNLGNTYVAAGDPTSAEHSFRQAITLRASYIDAHYALGKLLLDRQDYSEAEKEFKFIVNLDPRHISGIFHLGYTYYLQRKYDYAEKHYREVLKHEPGNIPALNNMGRLLERSGKFDDAIRYYKKALNLRKSDYDIHCNLARTYMVQQKWDLAEKEYRTATGLSPDRHEAHLGLGQALCELGNTDEAKSCFQRCLEIKPDLTIANYLLTSIDGNIEAAQPISDYVKDLFDKYADKFDEDLVNNLKYQTPEKINHAIRACIPSERRDYHIMDLGCGTGLCGPLLADLAARMDGIDLSPKMIEKAAQRGIYDELHVGEIVHLLNSCEQAYDLIISADVFVYFGDLSAVFEKCTNALRSGGLFAFSIELNHDPGYRLLSSGRNAHSESYIADLCQRNQLEIVFAERSSIRLEGGTPVEGMVFVAKLS